jgi:hypothetical protein
MCLAAVVDIQAGLDEFGLDAARGQSIFGDPNSIACGCAMAFWILLFLMSSESRLYAKAAVLLTAVSVILLTASRTGILALAAGALGMTPGKPAKMICYVLAMACAMTALSFVLPAAHAQRLKTIDIAQSRTSVMIEAWQVFLTHPFIGAGRAYWESGKTNARLGAHNSVIHALAEGGLLYGVPYTVSLAMPVIWLASARRWRHDTQRMALCVYCVYLVGAMGLVLVLQHGAQCSFVCYGMLVAVMSRDAA